MIDDIGINNIEKIDNIDKFLVTEKNDERGQQRH